MRAGQVARAAEVSIKALRHYEHAGLLAPQRLENGYREYSDQDVRLVVEIRALMSLGLSLRETRPFLEGLREGHEHGDDCPESVVAYRQKLDGVDELIARLTRERDELARRIDLAARRGFRHDESAAQEGVMSLPQPDPLPGNLPAPQDDGAARHLPGLTLPPLELVGTDGATLQLDEIASGRWVLFVYPLTGRPGVDVPRGWDEIPGARGCTHEACSFRDNLAALQTHGVERVLALSTDATEYQQDLARRLHLPYPLVSDPGLSLAQALRLPTFVADGSTLYKRLTMVLVRDRIEHVFYPIFPPDKHAAEVVQWVADHPRVRPRS